MNIFVVSQDPFEAASLLPNKLVVKMPLETAQILSTVLWSRGIEAPYRPTHEKHPCVLWAGETESNFIWLIKHGVGLCEEYTRRYLKIHASQKVIDFCFSEQPKFSSRLLTPFKQVMPDEFKEEDTVKAYRNYLKSKKYWRPGEFPRQKLPW